VSRALRQWSGRLRAGRLRNVARRLRNLGQDLRLSPAARLARAEDRRALPPDPGIDAVLDACIDWLRLAQDRSTSADGGVAGHYDLLAGWSTSYPETTGYIVPTMLAWARLRQDADARARARRMLDWLVANQFPQGGFQGGYVGDAPRVPVAFNTGQILLGLAAGQREFGTYRSALRRAADWLVAGQDPDGCWRRQASPFTAPGDKAYDTHVAWGLLAAAAVEANSAYTAAALANVGWALPCQREDGFLERCCLNDDARPLTHTLGYALRGIVEAFRASGDEALLTAARRTADGLLRCLNEHGFLPGRVWPGWRPAVDWACLTGTAQIACCWFALHELTGEERYLDAGRRANTFVRRTVRVSGAPELRGGVRGAYPVDGAYQRYRYINWAAKFCIDSNLLEVALGR